MLDLPPIQRLVALVGADEHAPVGQGVEVGAARHVDRHRPARAIFKRLPISADQRAALHLRGAQEAFGVLDLQVTGHLTIGPRAEQHCAAVTIGERDQRLGQRAGRGLGHHFQLQADAAAEDGG